MTFTDEILNEQKLFKEFEIKQRTKLVEFFERNSIKYLSKPNGSIYTTRMAINAPLLNSGVPAHDEIEFEM